MSIFQRFSNLVPIQTLPSLDVRPTSNSIDKPCLVEIGGIAYARKRSDAVEGLLPKCCLPVFEKACDVITREVIALRKNYSGLPCG